MANVFTEVLRSLDPEGELTLAALDELWPELRRLLLQELRRRGLGELSPRLVGILGSSRWTTPATVHAQGAPRQTRDALDELASDVGGEIFGNLLPNLQGYVADGQEIEPVVRTIVRQHLHDRHKRHDRLGFRIYQRLRLAVEELMEAGKLTIPEGGDKVDNRTVLAFERSSGDEPGSGLAAGEADARLATEVARWNDKLLLAWVSSEPGSRKRLVERLRSYLARLPEAGIATFSFGTLIRALKTDIRGRLAALLEIPGSTPTARGGDSLRRVVEIGRLQELSDCVEAGLEELSVQRRTRDQLERLWRFLNDFASSVVNPSVATGRGEAMAEALLGDSLPSNRALSRLLDFRADRFPALMARLRGEVERCVEEIREAPALATVESAAGPTGGGSIGSSELEAAMDDSKDLRRELQRRAAEAYRRSTEPEPRSEAPGAVDPPGNLRGALLFLAACPEPGIEWLVLADEESSGKALSIPADSLGWIGSSDVAVTDETGTRSLTLRCGHGVWLGRDALVALDRSGSVSLHHLERALACRSGWLAGAPKATATQRETDIDPDFRRWCRTLETARQAVCRAHDGQPDERLTDASEPGDPEPRRLGTPLAQIRRREQPARSRHWLPVAAALALALAGGWLLGWWLGGARLESRLALLESRLETERHRFTEELEAERSQAREERELLAERHRDQITSLEESFRDRISALLEPGLQPWLIFGLDRRRGPPVRLTVPEEATWVGLAFLGEVGDRLEIRDAKDKPIFTFTIETYVRDEGEVLLSVPSSILPPAEYEVRVLREGEIKTRFQLEIERP